MESVPILESDLVRVHPGRPAAHPTATGWDEERGPVPSVYDYGTDYGPTTAARALRVIVLDGSIRMSDHDPPTVPIGNGLTGGPESVRDG